MLATQDLHCTLTNLCLHYIEQLVSPFVHIIQVIACCGILVQCLHSPAALLVIPHTIDRKVVL